MGQGPRDGNFRIDLAHELGHAIVACSRGLDVDLIAIGDIVKVDGRLSVRGSCETIWWAGNSGSDNWNIAVVSTAGLVAERLSVNDQLPFEEFLETFHVGDHFKKDRADTYRVLSGILETRSRRGTWGELLREAYEKAHSLLKPSIAALKEYVIERERGLMQEWDSTSRSGASEPLQLDLEWEDHLAFRLCGTAMYN